MENEKIYINEICELIVTYKILGARENYITNIKTLEDADEESLVWISPLTENQSELIQKIAKKWGITVEKVLENIHLRSWMKQSLVEVGKKNPSFLEAKTVRDANNSFWMILEESKQHFKTVDYTYVKEEWDKWFNKYQGCLHQ